MFCIHIVYIYIQSFWYSVVYSINYNPYIKNVSKNDTAQYNIMIPDERWWGCIIKCVYEGRDDCVVDWYLENHGKSFNNP